MIFAERLRIDRPAAGFCLAFEHFDGTDQIVEELLAPHS